MHRHYQSLDAGRALENLAEQNAEDAKQLRWGWKADMNRLNAAKAEITALSKNVIDMTREDFDATLNNLRRMGASIDGDNAYKRDLCDSIVGAMVFGAQNSNPPPPGQWQQRFWDIARGEAAAREELVEGLNLIAGCLMDSLAGVDIPAVRAGRAIATASELIAKYPR